MKKKIYLIGSNISTAGGTQRVTANLANEFIKKNEVIILNTGKDTGKKIFDLDKKIKIIFFNIETENKKSKFNKIINLLKVYVELKKYFKTQKSYQKTCIGIGIGYSYILSILKLDKAKKIGSQHNPYSDNLIFDKIRYLLLNRLDFFITISKEMMNNTKERLHLKNCIYLPNFIETKEAKKTELDNKRILSIGRFTSQKGFDYLIDIWKKVIEIEKNYKLIIVGEGPLEREIREKIKKNNLESSIEIKSSTKNINFYYLTSDLYVMTSRHEGLPMVLLEAMSFGLPIISFDCPTGPKELVSNEENGYLIECFNIDLFSKKIIELLNDKIKMSEFSKNSIKISKKYSKDTVIKRWEEII
ncbi:glycosyltransferase family 4 protein [Cetobacterium sp.]|uniref:glycosyltransferase family 4 protein n=1 Tax=Cetobacterium sp. TaxID=2071632 RepID=UPI003F2F7C6E